LFSSIRKSIKDYIVHTDILLITLSLISSFYGLILVSSATRSFSSNRNVIIQFAAIVIGFVAMIIISQIDYENLGDIWLFLYIAGIAIMIFTIIFGTGPTNSGNRNWIDLKIISVQPSEFVKLIFIVSLAAVISRFRETLSFLKNLFLVLLLIGIMAALLLIQGDMGTTLVFLFIAVVMLFCGGLKLRYFIGAGILIIIAAPFIWTYGLTNYMRNRILFGFNPELDATNVGYQVVQSKIAIGSGKLLGKGLYNGPQIQNSVVPAKQTDFIFAVAGEELGFIGAVLVILLLVLIMLRILVNARNCESSM